MAFSAQATPPASAVLPTRDTAVAASPLPKIQQQAKHGQTEVKRLKREVARQESDSNRASQRLQEQDEQIAELRRKLSQLQSEPAAGHL